MFELPLFPLNTVIFPGTPIILHIFEDRYKEMFKDCIRNHKPFGVTLIREGIEANGPLATPHEIGCTARITMVEQLKDDRMNIIAMGGECFKVIRLNYERPYLVGDVEIRPLLQDAPQSIEHEFSALKPWVENYLEIMLEAELVNRKMNNFPLDPIEYTYQAAYLLQIPQQQKQELLEIENAARLIPAIRSHYRREVALLKRLIQSRKAMVESDPILN